MKEICIDARMINNAGIGTYLRTLLKNLFQTKFKISLIVNASIAREEQWLNTFDLIYLEAPIYSIKEQILFPFIIPKCDLFFSPHFNIPLFPIRAKKRLVTIHDVYHLAFLSSLKSLEKLYAKFVVCKAASHSDAIITVSEFSKSEIIKYTKVKNEKISVIHNAINLELFKKVENETITQEVIEKYNLPKHYFLFVGNLKPHKNLLNLIKAFEKICETKKYIYLVIIGKTENLKNSINIRKILEKKKELQNKIKVIDFVKIKDLPIIYQLAEALVFPSYYEGFGYPPLEAMASSCTTIVSKVASMPEVCKDASIYIDPYDYKSIFNAMIKVLEDKQVKKILIQKAKNTLKSFSINKFIETHVKKIESLL